VVSVELVLRARRARPKQGDQVRTVDLTRNPCGLDRGQGAQRAGVADPLASGLDREPLLAGQPRGTGLRATPLPHPIRVPPGEKACLGRFELGPQALREQDRPDVRTQPESNPFLPVRPAV